MWHLVVNLCIKTFFFSFLLRLHQTFPQGFTGKRGENGLKCSRQHSVDITAKSASRFFMTGDTKCCLHCLEEDFLTASNAFAVSNVYRLTPDAQPYTSSCRVVFRIITKRSAILLSCRTLWFNDAWISITFVISTYLSCAPRLCITKWSSTPKAWLRSEKEKGTLLLLYTSITFTSNVKLPFQRSKSIVYSLIMRSCMTL